MMFILTQMRRRRLEAHYGLVKLQNDDDSDHVLNYLFFCWI